MKLKNNNFYSKIPAGLTGLGLGVAGIGNAISAELNSKHFLNLFNLNTSIQTIQTLSYIIQGLLISITLICFLLISIKILSSFKVFKEELNHPLTSSYLPTQAMCLASIAYYIGVISTIDSNLNEQVINVGTIIATILDLTAIIFHIVLLFFFFKKIIMSHSIKNHVVYPSWLVPTCGIALSCCFEPKLGHLLPNEFFQVFWYFGLVSYLLMMPYIAYKLLFFIQIDKDKIGSIAIMFAAPNLLMAGLLSTFVEKAYYDDTFIFGFCILLLICSFLGFIMYYATFFEANKNKFNAGFASFTFPAAIGSLATIKLAEYIYVKTNTLSNAITNTLYAFISWAGFILVILGIIIIFYILVRYIILVTNIYKDNQ